VSAYRVPDLGRPLRLASVLAVIGLGACQQSGPAPEPTVDTRTPQLAPAAAPAAALDPCTLLTRAEVEEVVGLPVAAPGPHPGNAAICHFDLGDEGALGITTQRLAGDHTAERMIAEFEARNIQVRDASGLGERSFFAGHGYGITGLNTCVQERCLIITLFLADEPESRQEALAEALMRKALPRF
jgi:hypothetical protein